MSIVTIMNSIFASKQGRPSTLRQWCIFHPLFQISPLFARNCSDSVENFPRFTFSDFFWDFHPQIFLTTFFSHWPKILNPPIFAISIHFPLFREIFLLPPTFPNFPWFRKMYALFAYLMCFSFPPTLTMMHLCITKCTYWTPLQGSKLTNKSQMISTSC